MTFKAEDFEKKMGTCPRHGEQVLWLACEHVAKGSPEEIWLGPNRIVVCQECSMQRAPSVEDKLMIACAVCIRGKIKSLLDRLPEGANSDDFVKGLDVYEEELMNHENSKDE